MSISDLLSCCLSRTGKPSEHETDHRHVDPGFFAALKHFVVLGEPTPGGEPREGSLHDPSPFEDVEATAADLLPIDHRILWSPHVTQAAPRMLDDLDLRAKRLLDPLHKASFVVATLRPNVLEARETALERQEHVSAAMIILDVGFMHQHMQDHASRINQQVPFAPFHFLPAVIAASPPF
jgi:hypothetical protein